MSAWSTVSGTQSTTQSARVTGWVRSPSTRPTRSQASAQSRGYRRSSALTTSRTVGGAALSVTADNSSRLRNSVRLDSAASRDPISYRLQGAPPRELSAEAVGLPGGAEPAHVLAVQHV